MAHKANIVDPFTYFTWQQIFEIVHKMFESGQ